MSAFKKQELLTFDGLIREDGGLDFNCHTPAGMPYSVVQASLTKLRDELDRILSHGAARCPYAPHADASIHGIGPDTDGGPNPDFIWTM